MRSHRKEFGQFMTPRLIADLVAAQIPLWSSAAIDLAAGDCSLLSAIRRARVDMPLYGYEIDKQMHVMGKTNLKDARLRQGNGLFITPRLHPSAKTGLTVVGNPPFTEIDPTEEMQNLLQRAFPGITTKLGQRRSELYFLARSLLLAVAHQGMVVILMPISFADGDIYRQYRQLLMKHYSIRRAIEIPPNLFTATEARTVLLVIDTRPGGQAETEVARFNAIDHSVETIFRGVLVPGERLDARYHHGNISISANTPKLKDLGVTIVRGRLSRKEAASQDINAVHTTDLALATTGKIRIQARYERHRSSGASQDQILAKTGDILLSRTGTRVSWRPITVESGAGPITDHVFRIRAPKKVKQLVAEAFIHPAFAPWLESIAKGVCAAVLTKRELLCMPLFQVLAASLVYESPKSIR